MSGHRQTSDGMPRQRSQRMQHRSCHVALERYVLAISECRPLLQQAVRKVDAAGLRHALAAVAVHAKVLVHLRKRGPGLQRGCMQVAAAALAFSDIAELLLKRCPGAPGLQHEPQPVEAEVLSCLSSVRQRLTNNGRLCSQTSSGVLTCAGVHLITVRQHADAALALLINHAVNR